MRILVAGSAQRLRLLHNLGTGDGIVMALPEHYGRNVYQVLWREFSADSVARTRNKVRTAS